MKSIQISTENPMSEQWQRLSIFTYPSNIGNYFKSRNFSNITQENIELVAGSMRQAQAYFSAAFSAPLDVSPLLLYYGATSLLHASATLITNSPIEIKNHGMSLLKKKVERLADVEIHPQDPNFGALQVFSNIFSDNENFFSGANWNLGEILGSIPDLKNDFEFHYQDLNCYTIPIEIVKTKELTMERIRLDSVQRIGDLNYLSTRIKNLDQSYAKLQKNNDYVFFYRKIKYEEIGDYSISGKKFFTLGHEKNKKIIFPSQILLMFIGLFVLGFLPRYRPELWNPFVRSDITGEKFIIEKFISICHRFFPNLALNIISNERIQFVNSLEGILDLSRDISSNDLKQIIQETLNELKKSDASE